MIFPGNYLFLNGVLTRMTDDKRWTDINERVTEEWKEETTPFERIYEILEQTHNGQSAAEIAERALVSEPTARRHLDALVTTGFAATAQDGRTTLYRRDDDRMLMSRIRELRDQATRDEILDGIRRMKTEIRDYEAQYDALSPEELARQLPTGANEEWEDVTAWKTTRQNLAVAQAALAYDEASKQLTA
jgi:DNA-binding transcriptional ArsR family regulator